MAGTRYKVSHAVSEDLPQVLFLMEELARFEGYLDEFCVELDDLQKMLIDNEKFEVLNAKTDDEVVGIIVFYNLPFSYDLQPWLFIKELVVKSEYRSTGVGQALMKSLYKLASSRNVSRVHWDVLKSNTRARQFYLNLGAEERSDWSGFRWLLPAAQI